MDDREKERRLEAATCAVKKASVFLLEHEELRFSVEEKSINDFVTDADKKSEKIIYDTLLELFPSDSWYGEETGKKGDGKGRWIVDPIDGTVDFMWSFPNYTISVAYEDEEGIEVGVVMNVRQNELFSAIKGKGAFLNGKRINTYENGDYSKALAILVPPHRKHSIMDSYMVKMRRFYDYFTDMRSLGSAALSLCYVASSRAACYYEEALQLYDVAAGVLILTEAGGKVSIKTEEDSITVVASASSCHDKVLEIVCDKGSFV